MKLNELFLNEAEEKEEQVEGTYVAVRFSEKSRKALSKALKPLDIKNRHPSEKFHCTIMYSKNTLTDWEEENKEPIELEEEFNITEFAVFRTADDKNALVLKGECEYLEERHKKLVEEYEAEYTYDDYLPHVTISYDCGDIKVEELDISGLPEYLEVVEEYTEPVNKNYAG